MLPKLFVSLLLFWGVQCFPDGAPIDACVKDRPNQPNHGQHRTQPLSTLPYRVVASSSAYGPSSAITGLYLPIYKCGYENIDTVFPVLSGQCIFASGVRTIFTGLYQEVRVEK